MPRDPDPMTVQFRGVLVSHPILPTNRARPVRAGASRRRSLARFVIPWALLVELAGAPRPAQAQEAPEVAVLTEAGGSSAGPSTAADPTVLLMVDSPDRERLEEALRLELAGRSLAVLPVDAPAGETPLARAAAAQAAARFAAADAALWVEAAPAEQGAGAMLRAVTPDDTDASRFAPLPAPLGEVEARTFSVVAGSLVDELVSPPEPPIRVRVQVSVDATGREVEVTTVLPETDLDPAPTTEPQREQPDPPPAVPPPPPEALPPPPAVPEPPGPSLPAPVDLAGEDGHPVVELGVDLLPQVGTSTGYQGREIRKASVNLIGGWNYGVRGWEVGYLFNVNEGFVDGLQFTLGVNANMGTLNGLQWAGGLNITEGRIDGGQAAAIANYAGSRVLGGQVAGLVNVAAGEVDGVQISGFYNHAGDGVVGGQFGAVNVSQGAVDGVQAGLINVAESSDFSFGLINVIYGGRTRLEVSTDETGFINARLLNGGQHFHYLYSVGYRPLGGDGAEWSLGWGLGGHLPIGDGPFFIDLDLIFTALTGYRDAVEPGQGRSARFLGTGRVVLGWDLFDHLTLIGGLSYNTFVSPAGDADDGSSYGLFGARRVDDGAPGSRNVRTWPGVTLGIRFR